MCDRRTKSVDEILDLLIGIIPDEGKSLEYYKNEKIAENMELIIDTAKC